MNSKISTQHIFVANPKGGSGKTTIATQLASYYAIQEKSTLLIDHDPQKSSSDWYCARPQHCAPLQLIVGNIHAPIEPTHHSRIIHDLPAGWHPSLDSPLFAKTEATTYHMLIPVLPSPTDIKASLRFFMSLYRSGILEKTVTAGMIANRTRSNLRYNQILLEFLSRVDIPLLTQLRDSQNYIRAMEHGISIFDLPANAVKTDLETWKAVIDWLEPATSNQ